MHCTEICVIALSLACKIRMHDMVKFVAPLSVQAIPAALPRLYQTRVIQVAFGYDLERPAGALGQFLRLGLDGSQDRTCAEVEDRMDRIQTQSVEVKLFQPHASIVQHVIPHWVGA